MLGTVLRSLRKENGLSQEDLGKILNLDQRSISQYECSVRFPDEKTINKIANYFDVSIDYLFERTKIRNIYKHTDK